MNLIGAFHPLVLHFPIVLICMLLVLEVLYLIWRTPSLRSFTFWISLVTFVTTGLAVFTGWFAATHFAVDDFLYNHRLLGFVTFGFTALLASVQLADRFFYRPCWKWYSLTLSSLLLLSVTFGSDYGGVLTRGKTLFQTKQSPKLEEILPS